MPSTLARLTTAQCARALAAIADFTAAQGVSLRADDSAKAKRLDALTKKLEQRTATGADVAALSFELFVWQLGALRAQYAAQLEVLQTAKEPHAADAARAMLRVIDRSVAALRNRGEAPAELDAIRADVARVEASIAKARQTLARSTAGVPLRPLARQPTSSSGVALRPVTKLEAHTPNGALASFKLRPGALPPANRKSS